MTARCQWLLPLLSCRGVATVVQAAALEDPLSRRAVPADGRMVTGDLGEATEGHDLLMLDLHAGG